MCRSKSREYATPAGRVCIPMMGSIRLNQLCDVAIFVGRTTVFDN
jgi:hypothetical protein